MLRSFAGTLKSVWLFKNQIWPKNGKFGPTLQRSCFDTLQNRAAMIVKNSPYDASALPVIKQLGWLNIQHMIEFETTKIVH